MAAACGGAPSDPPQASVHTQDAKAESARLPFYLDEDDSDDYESTYSDDYESTYSDDYDSAYSDDYDSADSDDSDPAYSDDSDSDSDSDDSDSDDSDSDDSDSDDSDPGYSDDSDSDSDDSGSDDSDSEDSDLEDSDSTYSDTQSPEGTHRAVQDLGAVQNNWGCDVDTPGTSDVSSSEWGACCDAHDACFEKYGCTAESLSQPLDSPCQQYCNLPAADCMSKDAGTGPGPSLCTDPANGKPCGSYRSGPH